MSTATLALIVSIIMLFGMLFGVLAKLREAYKEIPQRVQGGAGSSSGSTFHEIAFLLFKMKNKGRLIGTLENYKWK